jgi:hypothetical protein
MPGDLPELQEIFDRYVALIYADEMDVAKRAGFLQGMRWNLVLQGF